MKPKLGQAALSMPIPPFVPTDVPDFTPRERFAREWQALEFSPSGHPMCFYRKQLEQSGVLPCQLLQEAVVRETVTIAGLCLRPHRPPTQSGEMWVFFTLEDETGLAQVTLSPDAYETAGPAVLGSQFITVTGVVEARGVGKILRATQMASLSS